MPERIAPGPVSGTRENCEAVCIHTKKIFDSCRDKDIAYYKFLPTKNQCDLRMKSRWKSAGFVFFSL